MNPNDTAEKIYATLLSFRFEEWQAGPLDAHFVGADTAPSKAEILEDIKRIFRLTETN